MKAFVSLLLLLSLGLNGALGLILLAGLRAPPSPVAPPATTERRAASVAAPPLAPAVWAELHAGTVPDLVARLREAGFPVAVIRGIVSAQVDEQLALRRRALRAEVDRMPYWKNSVQRERLQQALHQLSRERRQAMRDLLGAEAIVDEIALGAFPGRRVDGLPAGKAAEVQRIMREFDEQRYDLHGSGGALLEPEAVKRLEHQRREAIVALLTPAELEEFDLRNSNPAMRMRMELAAFQPTEAEFRAIFRLQRDFEERYLPVGDTSLTSAQVEQRTEARKLLELQIKSVLGPVRAEEYALKTDSYYQQIHRLTSRLELPPEIAREIHTVQQDLQGRARAVQKDVTLTAEGRQRQLAAIEEETARRLTPLLGGERGYEAYRQNIGVWLRALRPAPPAGASSPRP